MTSKNQILAEYPLTKHILADFPLNVNRKLLTIYNYYGDVMYKRIRELREDKDMSQTQIAQILSCSQRVYSNYERGELDIPTEILIKLSQFHQVSVDYILGLTNRTDKY